MGRQWNEQSIFRFYFEPFVLLDRNNLSEKFDSEPIILQSAMHNSLYNQKNIITIFLALIHSFLDCVFFQFEKVARKWTMKCRMFYLCKPINKNVNIGQFQSYSKKPLKWTIRKKWRFSFLCKSTKFIVTKSSEVQKRITASKHKCLTQIRCNEYV